MIIFFNEKFNPFSKFNKKISNLSKQDIQKYMPSISDVRYCSCPVCHSKGRFSYHGSYKRNFSYIQNDCLQDTVLTVSRVICNSCSHTHACLPIFIVPYKIMSLYSIIYIVSIASKTSVLKVANILNLSFELIYSYIAIFLSFFPHVNLLNNEKSYTKNFNQHYWFYNSVKFSNIQFFYDFFQYYQWLFLMTKFRNTTSPPIYIEAIL